LQSGTASALKVKKKKKKKGKKEIQRAAMNCQYLCRATVGVGFGRVQRVRNQVRPLRVRAQNSVILCPSGVVECNRKCVWNNSLLDPIDQRLERCCRLPSHPTGAMPQSRDFKVAEEVRDIWSLLQDSFIVVTGPSDWYNTISLLSCVRLVR
jgi:hypothetical protein